MGDSADQPTFDDILSAREQIETRAHKTPVLTCSILNEMAGAELFFKCENFQKVGAFKFRGACNAVFNLSSEQAERGVVTHSSGNHAQALALAARMRGIKAYIVMPSNAPIVKKDAVHGYGAEIVECEPTLAARESTAAAVQSQHGATFVHPYDNPHVIAGQGTAALELLEDVDQLDSIIAPVGGGGLISGTCLAVSGMSPRTKVVAAEPEGADDAAQSKKANRLIPQKGPNTIADGLLTSLGQLTWPFVRDQVERVETVSDSEIVDAMKLFWSRTKAIIEPSSATTVAVALREKWQPGSKVGVILSGGNVDLGKLPWVEQA